ncbi:MAG: VOC family protein [Xanthomonadales bacterium]|nr:VOC family protein [Xanthomonadales bacterium]
MRTRVLSTSTLALGLLLGCPVTAVEFEDYEFGRWSQEVTECDRLASHGRDPGHVAPAVSRAEMDKPAAIEACRAAVAADPDNPRLNYQLGRAYGYSGRGEEAMPYRLKALAADYPQSLFVIGYLHLLGATIEQDTCQALEYWKRGAGYRRLAALVALPRHTLRGDFDACGQDFSADDLRAYLNEAKTVSAGDYYVGLLADELLAKVDQMEKPTLPRVQRTNLVVRDMDQALAFYRDVLGFELIRVQQQAKDSYSFDVFEIEPGAEVFEAYLSGPGQARVLGLTAVGGMAMKSIPKPNRVALVVEVKDVDAVATAAEKLGLKLYRDDHLEGMDGRAVYERGILDRDGNLVVVYSYGS